MAVCPRSDAAVGVDCGPDRRGGPDRDPITGRATHRRVRLLRMSAALLATAVIVRRRRCLDAAADRSATAVVSRFTFVLPEGQMFTGTGRHVMTLSPDGTKLVYVANEQLYLRNMHELTSAPIPGTEGSNPDEPVFSPDGQWVAFHSRRSVEESSGDGWNARASCRPAGSPLGATWEDGRILLGQLTPPAIVEIPENGGAAKQLVTLNEKTGEQAESAVRRGRAVRAVYVAHARGRMGRRLDRRPRPGDRPALGASQGQPTRACCRRATWCTRARERSSPCRLTRHD